MKNLKYYLIFSTFCFFLVSIFVFGFLWIKNKSNTDSKNQRIYSDDSSIFSSFDSRKFECSGLCVCMGDDQSTSSSVVFSRRLLFFVSSATSIVALNKAKLFFKDECRTRLSDTCNEMSIKSEVDSCEETENVEKKEQNYNIEDDGAIKFLCNGHCMKNGKLRTQKSMSMASKFKCERLKLEEEVVITSAKKIPGNAHRVAIRTFMKEQLVEFCKKGGAATYRYWNPHSYFTSKKHINLCVGTRQNNNNHVHCRQTFPLPKTHKIENL